MKKTYLGMVLATALIFSACSSVDEIIEDNVEQIIDDNSNLPEDVKNNINNGSKSELSQELKDSITYMYSEEGLAYDVYLAIYKYQKVNQLENIATNSEIRHIEAVNGLAKKYNLNMTEYPDTDIPYTVEGIEPGKYPVEHVQELYDMLYDKGIQSKQEALEVGCMVEVTDINDLDEYIGYAERDNARDVLNVFTYLRNGSYNHYWAFDKGLVNMGINEGCCSLGTEWCHKEYPKKIRYNYKKRGSYNG